MPEVVNKTSNQAVKKATGKVWDDWIKFLDKLGLSIISRLAVKGPVLTVTFVISSIRILCTFSVLKAS